MPKQTGGNARVVRVIARELISQEDECIGVMRPDELLPVYGWFTDMALIFFFFFFFFFFLKKKKTPPGAID